jgi:hypothetical protein
VTKDHADGLRVFFSVSLHWPFQHFPRNELSRFPDSSLIWHEFRILSRRVRVSLLFTLGATDCFLQENLAGDLGG